MDNPGWVIETHLLKVATRIISRAQHCALSLCGEIEQLDKRRTETELSAAERDNLPDD